MARNLHDLRNIGIVAHIDAGKTTVTERILFYAGTSHRMGEVDKGTTTTDFDEEEQQRGITIYSACVTFPWKGKSINLIDTPGHVDFTAEVERSLRVLDGAVVVFSAREGVEAQSETVWRQADKYHVPRLCFINKLDREGAEFDRVYQEINTRLCAATDTVPVAIQIPVGQGPAHQADPFRGIIDLIEMKLLTFSEESQGAEVQLSDIPDDLRAQANVARSKMLDNLSNFSDELIHLLLEESPVPAELIRQVIRDATLGYHIVPVLCGSALKFKGIQPLLDAVTHYLPSPADVPAVKGKDPKNEEKILTRKPSVDEPFCALVFKILADKHGDLYYVRVYSGTLKSQSRVYNPRVDKKENASQLWHIQADRREAVTEVEAGDIVGILGLKTSVTGDTLCDPKDPIVLESITFPETVISMAVEPETSAERKKLADTLEALKRQDPTFRVETSTETGQTIVSGMGELHLEIIKNRLLRDFNLNVKVHKPRVSYRESVGQAVTVIGECHPVPGQQLFAKISLRVEPDAEAKPYSLRNDIPFEQAGEFSGLLSQIAEEQAGGGGATGFPLLNVRITLTGLESHESQTNEIALRKAMADAFNKAFREGCLLLEPIMDVEVNVPDEFVGNIVGDLQQRRAEITSTNTRGAFTVIEARVPLSNMVGYSGAMRSLSQGHASCSMEPSDYAPAPPDVREHFLSW